MLQCCMRYLPLVTGCVFELSVVFCMCLLSTGGFMKRAIQGTLEYMAPEVLLKKPASHASDVYALAIAINELASGRPFCTSFNHQ